MELTLSSGRVVEIKRPSVRDACRCEDIIVPVYEYEGTSLKKVSMPKSNLAWAEWAAAGLGVDVDALGDYSKDEREEIGLKVKEIASLNPESAPN
jgi:hypothetical protein